MKMIPMGGSWRLQLGKSWVYGAEQVTEITVTLNFRAEKKGLAKLQALKKLG